MTLPNNPKLDSERDPLVEWDEATGVFVALAVLKQRAAAAAAKTAAKTVAKKAAAVPSKAVRTALEKVLALQKKNMVGLTRQLQLGALSVSEWQLAVMAEIKKVNMAAGMIAQGGWKQMSQADFGYLGSVIKAQYQYMRRFAAAVASGEFPIEGPRILNRVAMYAEAGIGTYEETLRRFMIDKGAVLEQSILGMADHCEECIEAAGRGKQPVGTLPRIGGRICLTKCHCHFIYFNIAGVQIGQFS